MIIQYPSSRNLFNPGLGISESPSAFADIGGISSNFALGFDGVNDSVIASTPAIVSTPSTMTMWIYRPSGDNRGAIIKTGTSGAANGFGLAVGAANNADIAGNILNILAEGIAFYSTGVTVTVGMWHHIAFTRNGSTLSVYFNGVLKYQSMSGIIDATNTVLHIGGYAVLSRYFPGLIDDVRIYNRALTPSEIQSLYRNSSSPPVSGLVAHFPFEEGTGTTTIDSVGGLVGTLTNGPTWQPQTPPRLIADRQTQTWSRSFDGVDDNLDIAANLITKPSTTALWIKVRTFGLGDSGPPILQAGMGEHYWAVNGASRRLQFWNGVWRNATSGTVTTSWHHVALVANTGDTKMYLDGALVYSDAVAIATVTTARMMFGARFDFGSSPMDGLIKDVRIYSSALSATQIADLARGKEIAATPVGHWRLDEASGVTTAVDASGNGNNGTINGAVATGDIPQWLRQTIESSQSFSFDGVNDYVNLATATTLGINSATTPWTMNMWFKTSGSSENYLVDNFNGGNADISLRLEGGKVETYLSNTSGTNNGNPQYGSGFNNNMWRNLALTWDGAGTEIVYVDGARIGSTSNPALTGSFETNAAFRVGQRPSSPGSYYSGLLDDLRIYNRSLTPAEVIDIAAGFNVPAGLISYWKGDGNANDSVGSNNGTEQGGVTYSTDVPGTL